METLVEHSTTYYNAETIRKHKGLIFIWATLTEHEGAYVRTSKTALIEAMKESVERLGVTKIKATLHSETLNLYIG